LQPALQLLQPTQTAPCPLPCTTALHHLPCNSTTLHRLPHHPPLHASTSFKLQLQGTDPRFATNLDRVQNRDALKAFLAERVGMADRAPLMEQLQERVVPSGAVNSMAGVFEMPQAEAQVGWMTGTRDSRRKGGAVMMCAATCNCTLDPLVPGEGPLACL
jgi:hypothetical protein